MKIKNQVFLNVFHSHVVHNLRCTFFSEYFIAKVNPLCSLVPRFNHFDCYVMFCYVNMLSMNSSLVCYGNLDCGQVFALVHKAFMSILVETVSPGEFEDSRVSL